MRILVDWWRERERERFSSCKLFSGQLRWLWFLNSGNACFSKKYWKIIIVHYMQDCFLISLQKQFILPFKLNSNFRTKKLSLKLIFEAKFWQFSSKLFSRWQLQTFSYQFFIFMKHFHFLRRGGSFSGKQHHPSWTPVLSHFVGRLWFPAGTFYVRNHFSSERFYRRNFWHIPFFNFESFHNFDN